MNHIKIYENIIQNAKSGSRNKSKYDTPGYIYYEKHHILPRCLNGGDEKENLVLLTAREHYIAHKLLTFIYLNNKRILHAFHYMTWTNKNIVPSLRDYKYAKELKAIAMGPGNNPSCDKEVAKKIGNGNRGKKRSLEAKKNYSDSKMGHTVSKESIIKMNKTKKERNIIPWMVGKKHKLDSLKKMKESLKKVPVKKCEYCGFETTPGNYARWHGNNCKLKTS